MAARQEDVNAWFAANTNATPEQIYSAAQQYSVPGYMIDVAVGNRVGSADAWVSSQGLQALPGGSSSSSTGTSSGGLLNSAPKVSTVAGTGTDPLSMDAAYRKIYNEQVAKSGSGESYDYWRNREIGSPWIGTISNVDKLGDAYYSGQYNNKAEEQAAWDNLLQQSGLDEAEFNSLYGQYMDRVQVKDPINPIQSAAQYNPIFNSGMVDSTDTVEGRIQSLLAANNPVIRQAGDRARQAFADRGLLNSSMAEQAAYEAMVSKAIDIAGPDAERYFQNRWKNTDWQNKFAMNEQLFNYDLQKMDKQNEFATDQNNQQQSLNMQTNYQQAIANIDSLYKQQMLAVQGAEMNPEDKAVAIQNLTVTRDNSIRLMTATFQQFPGWQSDWSKLVGMLGT